MDFNPTAAPTDTAAAPTAASIIGEARAYDELIELFRQRCAELGTSMETIDTIAGTSSRYVSKLLCSTPIKNLGPTSMGLLLGALAVKLVLVVDAPQLEKIKSRLIPKASSPASRRQHNFGNVRLALVKNSAWGSVMRTHQVLKQSPRKRREIARNAALVRWARAGAHSARHRQSP
jgi:hypothetical protein